MSIAEAYHEGFKQGVLKATADPTFEEANTVGFPSPYSLVVALESPLKKLLALRQTRLLNREI